VDGRNEGLKPPPIPPVRIYQRTNKTFSTGEIMLKGFLVKFPWKTYPVLPMIITSINPNGSIISNTF
jgi:hypothetical protein